MAGTEQKGRMASRPPWRRSRLDRVPDRVMQSGRLRPGRRAGTARSSSSGLRLGRPRQRRGPDPPSQPLPRGSPAFQDLHRRRSHAAARSRATRLDDAAGRHGPRAARGRRRPTVGHPVAQRWRHAGRAGQRPVHRTCGPSRTRPRCWKSSPNRAHPGGCALQILQPRLRPARPGHRGGSTREPYAAWTDGRWGRPSDWKNGAGHAALDTGTPFARGHTGRLFARPTARDPRRFPRHAPWRPAAGFVKHRGRPRALLFSPTGAGAAASRSPPRADGK